MINRELLEQITSVPQVMEEQARVLTTIVLMDPDKAFKTCFDSPGQQLRTLTSSFGPRIMTTKFSLSLGRKRLILESQSDSLTIMIADTPELLEEMFRSLPFKTPLIQ